MVSIKSAISDGCETESIYEDEDYPLLNNLELIAQPDFGLLDQQEMPPFFAL